MSVAAPQKTRRMRVADLPPSLLIGGAIIVMWLLLAIFADFAAPYSPIEQDVPSALQPPSLAHLLGTDNYGRDILSRIIYGARIDLQIGLFGVLFPFVIGNVIGMIAGYFGGWVDNVLMRILEVTIAFPFFVLVIAIISILGPGLISLYIALALVGWVSYARLTRARVLVLKGDDFVGAARVLGYSNTRIMLRHLLPNVMGPVLVIATINLALAIILEATLSFLGVGLPPTQPSLGTLIDIGQDFLFSGEWWITIFPGAALAILVLAVNLLGDWLRDALNPKLR